MDGSGGASGKSGQFSEEGIEVIYDRVDDMLSFRLCAWGVNNIKTVEVL